MGIILLAAVLSPIVTCGLYCMDFRFGATCKVAKHRA